MTRAGKVSIHIAVAQAGPVQSELIEQRCDRPSNYRDWSRGGAWTVHQLATVTPDDGQRSHSRVLGYEVAESKGGRFRIAYVDTVADVGFCIEGVEQTPGFLDQRRIVEACATWDGTDPVRLLTRDGYRVP